MFKVKRSFRPRFERLEDRLVPTDNPSMVPPPLNSLPGAAATLYLDFNGHFDASWASFSNVDTPPYDTDNNVNVWSATEIQEITAIWTFVAEDYAPLNINVSTVVPVSFDKLVAQRVSIGGDGLWFDSANPPFGVGLLNTFSSGTGQTETVYVFEAVHPYDATFQQNVAFTASHEAGHAFGLDHQAEYDSAGNLITAYSLGLPDGTSPLMGTDNTKTRNMFWFGPTPTSVTTLQDDLAVLSSPTNAFGYRTDEAGGTTATAAAIVAPGTGTVRITKPGVIAQMTDVDIFSFKALAGPVTFTADVVEPYNNLDLKLELRNSAGAVLASDDPGGSFDATISFNLPTPGTYYLAVSSTGPSSASTPTNYGINVGGYTIDGTFVVDSAAQQADAVLRLYGPVRWKFNRRTKTYSAVVTVMTSVSIAGPVTLSIKLPHASIQWLSPSSTRTGKVVQIKLDHALAAYTPFRFTALVKNPLKVNLGTFFKGLKIVG